MANVYRRGTKSVHRGTRYRPELDVESIPECAFDVGDEWGPAEPAGPRCEACFGATGSGRNMRRPGGRRPAVVAATTAAILAAAAVFAASVDTPVNILGPYATASGDVTSAPFASVTPGPARSQVPALTPLPSLPPAPTTPPLPTYPPIPTFGPLPTWPTWPPFPTFTLPMPPIPTLPPLPTCVHPGIHLGVDACKWPHQ